MIARKRAFVVDDDRLPAVVHVDAVDAAAQKAAAVGKRLGAAELELEVRGREARKKIAFAVEVGRERPLELADLGALDGCERHERAARPIEPGLEREMPIERLAQKGAGRTDVLPRHLSPARFAEALVEAFEHAVREAAHLGGAEARVRLGQVQPPRGEPLARAFEVRFESRGRQHDALRVAAGPVRARRGAAGQRDALCADDLARARKLPLLARPRRERVGRDEREVLVQRVLARRAREGDEARRQTRRPIGILPRARGRAAVAVEQLFEHDGRIRLARVLRVELALAHHLRARAHRARKKRRRDAASGSRGRASPRRSSRSAPASSSARTGYA